MSEEQEQELEVLDSIYPDELTKISENEFNIELALEVPHQDVDAEDYEPPVIILHVKYLPNYPDTAPELEVTIPSRPSSAEAHPIDLDTDLPRLREALNTAVEENMGMAMVFTLTSTLKDTAETIIRERVEKAEAIQAEIARKEEEKEMEKFRGEMVTKEVFEKWRLEFRAEVREKKEREEREKEELAEKARKGAAQGKKLTGRELFEKGLAGGVEDDIEVVDEEEEEVVPEVDKLKISA